MDRGWRAVFDRAVTLSAASLEHLQDAGDHPSIIYTPGVQAGIFGKRSSLAGHRS
jgi:hypothetical protein